LRFQNVPDIHVDFSIFGHIHSCNSSNRDTFVVDVNRPYFSTSDIKQMFAETTSLVFSHVNNRSLSENFYKLQAFPGMLDKTPGCIAISEK